jgi:hypothetical protein
MPDRPFLLFLHTCWYPNQWIGILWDLTTVFFEEHAGYIFAGQGLSLTEAMARSKPLYVHGKLNQLFLKAGADFLQ